MMRVRLTFALVVLFVLSGFASKQLKFYNFKKVGKHIDVLTQNISSDQPNFTFGFQSYNTHKIVQTTAYYNQPSDLMHYVLSTENGRTLYFQIPLKDVEIIQLDTTAANNYLYFQCGGETGIRVKEHRKDGIISFDLRFTSYRIPLATGYDEKAIRKACKNLVKLAAKYRKD